ncbi:MAG: hypothetical protein MUC94_15970, partial [bacterium]|nr:hypothetical protein [bacterium]
MKIRLVLIFNFVVLLTFFCSSKKSTNSIATHGNLALINGTLIDGTGTAPISHAAIVIENEMITAVGKLSEIALPSEAEIIDVDGATILPGFFNAHVHQAYNEHNLKTWAQAGVTTVRDLGGNPQNNLFAFRDRVNQSPQYARLV